MDYKAVLTKDGSFSAYSEKYNEHYHSINDGALNETLHKHIVPAFNFHKDKKELTILDICFGLGFNTLATLYYASIYYPKIKLNIYSPELNIELLEQLNSFTYPKEFKPFLSILKKLLETGSYRKENLYIELYKGDARVYIKQLKVNTFDIIYQDAFSPNKNPLLWTKEYFRDIKYLMNNNAIITTYSVSSNIRLSMYENDLHIYEYDSKQARKGTIASIQLLTNYKYIDMELKKQRNPEAKALLDEKVNFC